MANNVDLNIKLNDVWSGLGGCGANICYTLALLNREPDCIAPLGQLPVPHPITTAATTLPIPGDASRAFIVTDPTGTQRTYFAPGSEPSAAAWQSHLRSQRKPAWVIQAPLNPALMLEGLLWAHEHGAQTVWCPGQYSEQMNSDQIRQGLALSHLLILNQTERGTYAPYLHSFPEVWQVTTYGSEPVTIEGRDELLSIPVPLTPNVDPTGCGDAFIAGLTSALVDQSEPLQTDHLQHAVTEGIRCASACLTTLGCQNHQLNLSS